MSIQTTVVVPHYRASGDLALCLAGLDEQSMPADQFEVLVADDGSPDAPVLASHSYRVRVLRQDRRGFRAAAARNLGLHHAAGSTVCFLDCDVVPAPDYLERMTDAVADGHTVAVGSRRHVDLTDWDAAAVRAWLGRGADGPSQLADPEWLAEGYAATADLQEADDASFRFVISAVMAGPREFFCDIGGFDERFVGYGGEDWELAQRCWLAGADLRHVSGAVGYHNGPDLAARSTDVSVVKNRETATLAKRLTHPIVRGTGLVYQLPDIVVEADVSGWSLGQLLASVPTWLAGSDAGVWLTGGLSDEALEAFAEDPRVHTGQPAVEVTRRCRARVRICSPVRLRVPLCEAVDAAGPATGQPTITVTRTRELGRSRLVGTPVQIRALDTWLAEPVGPDVVVERVRQLPA